MLVCTLQFFKVVAGPQLYYLHPDVSFFKGDGFKAIGPALDMPDNSASGDVSVLSLSIGHSRCCPKPALGCVSCDCFGPANTLRASGVEPSRH